MSIKLVKQFEKYTQEFLEGLGLSYPYTPQVKKFKAVTKNKVLVLSDIHEPYTDDNLFKQVYEKDGDCDIVILAGDIGDFYSKSRFKKTKLVSFKEELRSVFFRMEWLSSHFRNVKMMVGNHDNRPEKKFQELLGGDVDLLFLTENNLMKRLASFFDNIELVGTTLKTSDNSYNIDLTHIWQFNDIIFTHAEISATQESAILTRISQQLFRWKENIGLKPYKIIMQGHNHTALIQHKGNEVWCLLPCLANSKSIGFGYIYSAKMIGNPPQVGYVTLFNDKGKTDINSIKLTIIQ